MSQGADASGEPSGLRSGELSPDGRWVTYDELGRIRGIGRESAVKLVQRKRWRRVRGNDGEARVYVPSDWLLPIKAAPDDASPDDSPHDPPDIPRIMAALEATIGSLTVRAERAEAEADRTIAALKDARERGDRERTRADHAEQRAREVEAALAAEQAARTKAEGEAAALRQTDQERRARGVMARLKAAWRGE
jgi:hypothetical protein